MKLLAENYTPQSFLPQMRRQARTVWSVSFLIVFVWLFLILLAPVAEANNFRSVSAPIYKFFGFVCHQIPARSFHVAGHQLAVCSRCFGVYFGLFFGFIVYPLLWKIEEIEPLPRVWLFAAMIPIAIDWSLGVFGVWENTHFSRFFKALLMGTFAANHNVWSVIS